MALAPLDELQFLTEALRAHVEWAKVTGSHGLPACDPTWLEARREHYRRTPYQAEDAVAPHQFDESPVPLTGSERAETADVAGSPTAERVAPLPEHEAESPLDRASPESEAQPRSAAPSVASRSAPRASAPSAVGVEVASFVNKSLSTDAKAVENPRPLEAKVEAPPVSARALDSDERRARLKVLEEQVRECRDCGLCEERTNTVFARGTGSVGVAFVGEGPGADEDAQGYPFVGAAGQLLDKMIAAMGLERDAVYVCNIVKCRPPKNRKPSEEEMAACRHYVVSQLELVQPRVIVALGATAVEGLLGLKLGITRLRGTWRLYNGSIPVMPTFHPAYLLRQPDAKREVWEDLQAVLTRINMPLPQRRK